MKKPLICTLNIRANINNALEPNYSLYKGSIGNLVEVKNVYSYDQEFCLLNNNFPPNIHEYDIFIIDLTNDDTIPFVKAHHTRTFNKSGNNTYCLVSYPQTIFDPRAFALSLLKPEIASEEILLVIFCSEKEHSLYNLVNKQHGSGEGTYDLTNYDFLGPEIIVQNKYGKETFVKALGNDLKPFLEKYNENFNYHTVFSHPYIWEDRKQIKDPNFVPLITNKSEEIVSFYSLIGKSHSFLFPDLANKKDFLIEFLKDVAPELFPQFFPNSEKNKWLNSDSYLLPNEKALIDAKGDIERDYREKIELNNTEIELNSQKYKFLHELLTETGDFLVQSVIVYFNWLGYENVTDMDKHSVNKDEDIQIETDKGLLIFEVKGIGGTSKDSDCSQIGKIKYRRSKERGKFDVFANYVVNHQRHMPAHLRNNPPFTETQIQDAINDERGLTTTWDLFNLYYNIEEKIITKADARATFQSYGLLNFYSSLISLGRSKEILKQGTVIILIIKDILSVGDKIFLKHAERYQIALIISLKVNNIDVATASNCEVGIKINVPATKQTEFFIK